MPDKPFAGNVYVDKSLLARLHARHLSAGRVRACRGVNTRGGRTLQETRFSMDTQSSLSTMTGGPASRKAKASLHLPAMLSEASSISCSCYKQIHALPSPASIELEKLRRCVPRSGPMHVAWQRLAGALVPPKGRNS